MDPASWRNKWYGRFWRTLTFADSSKLDARMARYGTPVRQELGDCLDKSAYADSPDADVALERSLGWKGAAANLMAFSIAMGMFNLPHVASVLGVVPFILMVIVYQAIMWYAAMAYLAFQRRCVKPAR